MQSFEMKLTETIGFVICITILLPADMSTEYLFFFEENFFLVIKTYHRWWWWWKDYSRQLGSTTKNACVWFEYEKWTFGCRMCRELWSVWISRQLVSLCAHGDQRLAIKVESRAVEHSNSSLIKELLQTQFGLQIRVQLVCDVVASNGCRFERVFGNL